MIFLLLSPSSLPFNKLLSSLSFLSFVLTFPSLLPFTSSTFVFYPSFHLHPLSFNKNGHSPSSLSYSLHHYVVWLTSFRLLFPFSVFPPLASLIDHHYFLPSLHTPRLLFLYISVHLLLSLFPRRSNRLLFSSGSTIPSTLHLHNSHA